MTTERSTQISPRLVARMAGLFSLLTILGGLFAQGYVSNQFTTLRDAAVTATNILAHKGLFQLGLTVFLIEMACNVAMTALYYVMLRPVSQSLAVVATFWNLTACIMKTFARVFFIAPVYVLGNSSVLSAFTTEQLQQIALVLLRINNLGAACACGFFGLSIVVQGYLIYRSTFLPRWLGVVAVVTGAGWLAFLSPPLGSSLFVPIAVLALAGAAVTIFWLLVFGLDEQKWFEQASKA